MLVFAVNQKVSQSDLTKHVFDNDFPRLSEYVVYRNDYIFTQHEEIVIKIKLRERDIHHETQPANTLILILAFRLDTYYLYRYK